MTIYLIIGVCIYGIILSLENIYANDYINELEAFICNILEYFINIILWPMLLIRLIKHVIKNWNSIIKKIKSVLKESK